MVIQTGQLGRKFRSGRSQAVARARARARARICVLSCAVLFLVVSPGSAQDRDEELKGLREAIQDSRGRVGEHEAGERAILEQLETVDRRLQSVTRDRASARREVRAARQRLANVEPELETAQKSLSRTQRALSTRANALYRAGEIGAVRVLFSASSLPDLLSRASALRVLVRHDAELVTRYANDRDRLTGLQEQAASALRDREAGRQKVTRIVARLQTERDAKGEILGQLRKNRTSERRLLLELEQAAKALEETIRSLGTRAAGVGEDVAASGFMGRKGRLPVPVLAEIIERFGKVVDPEFQTTTFRSGVDFAAKAGAAVSSVAGGIVRFSGWFRGYGRIVIVDHGDGFHSISGHLDEIFVEVSQPVEEGQALGTVGETGSLGGPSLYFELRRNGDPVDPELWLQGGRH